MQSTSTTFNSEMKETTAKICKRNNSIDSKNRLRNSIEYIRKNPQELLIKGQNTFQTNT